MEASAFAQALSIPPYTRASPECARAALSPVLPSSARATPAQGQLRARAGLQRQGEAGLPPPAEPVRPRLSPEPYPQKLKRKAQEQQQRQQHPPPAQLSAGAGQVGAPLAPSSDFVNLCREQLAAAAQALGAGARLSVSTLRSFSLVLPPLPSPPSLPAAAHPGIPSYALPAAGLGLASAAACGCLRLPWGPGVSATTGQGHTTACRLVRALDWQVFLRDPASMVTGIVELQHILTHEGLQHAQSRSDPAMGGSTVEEPGPGLQGSGRSGSGINSARHK